MQQTSSIYTQDVTKEAKLLRRMSWRSIHHDLPPGAIQMAAVHGMSLEGLAEAEQWAASLQEPAQSGELLKVIERRRETLQEWREEANSYDRDD